MIFKKELLIKIKDQEKININNITRLNKENNNNGIHTIHARMYKDTLILYHYKNLINIFNQYITANKSITFDVSLQKWCNIVPFTPYGLNTLYLQLYRCKQTTSDKSIDAIKKFIKKFNSYTTITDSLPNLLSEVSYIASKKYYNYGFNDNNLKNVNSKIEKTYDNRSDNHKLLYYHKHEECFCTKCKTVSKMKTNLYKKGICPKCKTEGEFRSIPLAIKQQGLINAKKPVVSFDTYDRTPKRFITYIDTPKKDVAIIREFICSKEYTIDIPNINTKPLKQCITEEFYANEQKRIILYKDKTPIIKMWAYQTKNWEQVSKNKDLNINQINQWNTKDCTRSLHINNKNTIIKYYPQMKLLLTDNVICDNNNDFLIKWLTLNETEIDNLFSANQILKDYNLTSLIPYLNYEVNDKNPDFNVSGETLPQLIKKDTASITDILNNLNSESNLCSLQVYQDSNDKGLGVKINNTADELYRNTYCTTHNIIDFIKNTTVTANNKVLNIFEALLNANKKSIAIELFKYSHEHLKFNNLTLLKNTINIQNNTELIKALALDKNRFNKSNTLFELLWYQKEKALNTQFKNDDIDTFKEFNLLPIDPILKPLMTQTGLSVKQINNFLKTLIDPYEPSNSIYGLNKKQYYDYKFRLKLDTYNDYLSMARTLKMDTTDPKICKPKDIKAEHDRLVKLIEERKQYIHADSLTEKFPNLPKVFKLLKDFEFESKTFKIIAPKSILDIFDEGTALNHCVDKHDFYFERMNEFDSFILFLRKANNPNKPWYTLEVEPSGTIRQKRTMHDNQNKDLKDATSFLKKWQQFIKTTQSDKLKDEIKKSEERRIENLKQIRKEGKLVYNGKYAGKLLADILENDLMLVEA